SCDTSILVIYTGGTIGMDFAKNSQTLVPFDFRTLMQRVPELKRFEFRLTLLIPFEPIDSSNMHIEHWVSMAKIIRDMYEEYDGFVILHGTDTMAYSASALSFLLQNLCKPVILTGSQIPLGANRTDARENLITALEIASMKKNDKGLIPEVCIYFDNVLLRGNRSRKVQSMDFAAFESENYPHLAESGIFINLNETAILPHTEKPLCAYEQMDNAVMALRIFPGMHPSYINLLAESTHLKGLVIESFGAGNLPTAPWLLQAIDKMIRKGIAVINVSQCAGGRVIQGRYETSVELQDLGVISGRDMTLEAAICKTMFVLGNYTDSQEIKDKLLMPLRGEMSL
ncbi:MAG: asparaginase, partial [Bernardetiaceae bacterium]|nr:asparaginase [Bernardetiaceae bacterium]